MRKSVEWRTYAAEKLHKLRSQAVTGPRLIRHPASAGLTREPLRATVTR